MSEPLSDLDWWAATRYPSVDDDWRPSSSSTGRHAINEDAAETPIFHALSTGAWRTREPAAPPAQPPRGAQRRTVHERPAADPVEAFRRDPLTMPIPTASTASTEAARRAAFGAHALRPERQQPERQHRPERRQLDRRQPEPRQPEPRQPERRQPERRRPERSRQSERSWGSEPVAPRQPESRYPEYPPRREAVSDSGRHHQRRPPISSLL